MLLAQTCHRVDRRRKR